MQINNAISAYRNVGPAATQRPTASTPATTQTDAADSASFQPSHALQQSLSDAPVVNREKVDAIKAAIASGAFGINPEKIADSLLKAAAERISTQA